MTTTIYNATAAADQRRLTHWGEMSVRSSTGFSAKIAFKEEKTVQGTVLNPAKQRVLRLVGRWDKGINR